MGGWLESHSPSPFPTEASRQTLTEVLDAPMCDVYNSLVNGLLEQAFKCKYFYVWLLRV